MLNQLLGAVSCMFLIHLSLAQKTDNPIIFADMPDISMVRVGDSYYMSSTTMHMRYAVKNGIPQFTGYCFALFNYVTKNIGVAADFDYFPIDDKISK